MRLRHRRWRGGARSDDRSHRRLPFGQAHARIATESPRLIHAAVRADKLMDAGDMEGRAVWLRIKAAVEEILRIETSGLAH